MAVKYALSYHRSDVIFWGDTSRDMDRKNSKAGLMKRKRSAIVEAAREAFLESGYAETSMDRIAAAAGVSIKPVYVHFKNKDHPFSAVMQAPCTAGGPQDLDGSNGNASLPLDRPWFSRPAPAPPPPPR